jgi:hypothetical protein
MNKATIMYRVPEWALDYIINGDCTNLTEQEIGMTDLFIRRERIIMVSIESEEPYFSHSNDIGGLACSVYDCNCLVSVID